MRLFKHIILISFLCLLPSLMEASIKVPDDLRNPFKIADPRGFDVVEKETKKDPFSISQEKAAEERDKAYYELAKLLRSLPFHGLVSSTGKANDCVVILGEYIFCQRIDVNPDLFDFNGSIYVLSVSEHNMVLSVTMGKETRELRIPFQK